MKALILPVMLCMAVALAACGSEPAASPSAQPSPAPSATVTPTESPAPTLTPTATATLEPAVELTVSSLTCERFFPGIPNPDGPNEWLNVSGSIANTGQEEIELPGDDAVTVRVLDRDGALVVSLTPKLDQQVLDPGTSLIFFAEPVNAEHPAAATCEIEITAGDQQPVVIGTTSAEVTIFAAP